MKRRIRAFRNITRPKVSRKETKNQKHIDANHFEKPITLLNWPPRILESYEYNLKKTTEKIHPITS